MNAVALVLSIFMLLSWQGFYTSVDGGTVIPTLTVCREMGMGWLTVVYGVCLLLCLLSTGVTTTFGFVPGLRNCLCSGRSPTPRPEALWWRRLSSCSP